MLSYFQAAVIGLIQGVTELFPVSSLGHSVLVPALIGGSWKELVTQADAKPFERGVHSIGKKVVEEAAEVWMAAEYEGREKTAEEISQLLYHLQVLMLATGLSLEDVYAHL